MNTPKRALILLSGGLDSATCLAIAQSRNFECTALSFDYGQRHANELAAAGRIASAMRVARHDILRLDFRQWGGSALTSDAIEVPEAGGTGIPLTYVPARNLVFLSLAAARAEILGIHDIFIGVNSVDYSGYPDCRPAFIEAFQKAANLGTKAADEDWKFTIHAPLQNLSKAEIIRLGTRLGVDYSLTTSCYNPDSSGASCGHCDSCMLRHQGFMDAGIQDPTKYHTCD